MKNAVVKMKNILFLFLFPVLVFGQKQTIVHINTDNYPSETRWVLHADSLYGSILGEVPYNYYTQSETSYTDTLYIPDSLTNITFVIYDSYGDGISSPGSYFMSVCGDTIVNYPNPNFTTGLYSNRMVPQCLPNPPPPANCIPAVLNINLDQFPGETTWEIHDSTGVLLAAGGPYSNAPDYQPQYEPLCLPPGPISLTMYDTYGDGLAGSQWGGNDGSYYLIQCLDTLVFGDIANYGLDTTHVFLSDTCPPPPVIPGCMDDDYVEFNPLANMDDGSCQTLKIYGCIDSTAFNYDSLANSMDYIDSCSYTLTLTDLAGNGWVGSRLEIYQSDTTIYYLSSGFSQSFNLNLNAPEPVKAKFFINQQASMTAIECGFSLVSSTGDTTLYVPGGFSQPILPFFTYVGTTYCGTECIPVVYGCLDSLAYNYDSLANTLDICYYSPGCMNPGYLEYYNQGFTADFDDGSCNTLAVFGCTDSTMFNYDSTANVDNGGCVPIIMGCMQPLAFNYNSLANTDDGSCVPYIYGCTDPTMFNYDSLANTDDGSCIPFVYGCMDSTMFNFNPLANADNNTCIPFIYGCTDPSMLNYDPSANTEDFSCIPFIYGCTDSTALNYDSLANTDNGSCIPVVEGCMDVGAYNYNELANVSVEDSCLYDAECITGPGNPYWLNDECYAWVIEVDDYCCQNDWDNVCQLTYDYCLGTWTGPLPPNRKSPTSLIVYPNPTEGFVKFSEYVDVSVYDFTGKKVLENKNTNNIDLSDYSNGIYNIIIIFEDNITQYKLIKE
tara:strand:+ start:2695 stop:5031 length:2337 start_codon:yes stop_codon:yes gene_type:complete